MSRRSRRSSAADLFRQRAGDWNGRPARASRTASSRSDREPPLHDVADRSGVLCGEDQLFLLVHGEEHQLRR